MRITVPVPPLGDQERIARILDEFEQLVNGQEYGLPSEIRARHEQYTHYRSELLAFAEAMA